jgi:carbamoyl-phosphate synthase large subunit
MAGRSWPDQGVTGEIVPPYYSVKEAVFPFVKFPGVDTILGPEMKSTGEVMGVGAPLPKPSSRAQLAAGVKLPTFGQGLHQRQAERPAEGDRGRARTARARLHAGRDARHGAVPSRRPAFRCGGQQGDRRPSAHRRHDQERRDLADHQYGRGEAQAITDSRSIRTRRWRQGDDVHDDRRAPRGACMGMRHDSWVSGARAAYSNCRAPCTRF